MLIELLQSGIRVKVWESCHCVSKARVYFFTEYKADRNRSEQQTLCWKKKHEQGIHSDISSEQEADKTWRIGLGFVIQQGYV